MDSLTLSEIADEARLIYTGYPEAAKTYRRDTQILQEIRDCGGMAEAERDLLGNCIAWGKICQRHSEAVGKLAIAVATHLPEVFVDLRLVSGGQRWHDDPGFDWDAAESELRRIEAAALTKTESEPVEYLLNWRDILVALGLSDNTEDRGKVRRLNEQYCGPILFPKAGGQPKAERGGLLSWWNRLAVKWEIQSHEIAGRRLSAETQYPHGREGVIAPEIAGSVRGRKCKSDPPPTQTS